MISSPIVACDSALLPASLTAVVRVFVKVEPGVSTNEVSSAAGAFGVGAPGSMLLAG